MPRRSLQRLLRPASIAVIGGDDAAEVVRQCRRSGFAGSLWAVSASRDILAGLRCCPSVEALPEAPDAAFVAVPREQAVQVVAALARRGAGGAVCYASGFAEVGDEGVALQQSLLQAAADMPLLGPNCYGLLNHLEGSALWPDRAGGGRVDRGVAILTQSGNIGLNLSMQRHHLPVACVVSLGNMAQLGFHDLIEALLDDARISAIGLHVEGLDDAAAFSRAALRALHQGVPIVALKTGASQLGAQLAGSHTSALCGPDRLVDALFDRVGIARVADLPQLLEALKLLHVCGPLAGTSVGSLSCSGGEASLVADLGERAGLRFPALPARVRDDLGAVLGPQVPLANPLDYHTYIWADVPALTRCFAAMRRAPVDASMLVLDFPNVAADGGAQADEPAAGWAESLQACLDARAAGTMPSLIVSTMAELMPASAAARAIAAGVAPMQGLSDCLQAIAAAARIGRCRGDAMRRRPIATPIVIGGSAVRDLDEAQAKAVLSASGVPVPTHRVAATAEEALAAAHAIGFPVVVKTIAAGLLHKSECGAVRLNLRDVPAVREAVAAMPGPWLVEAMAHGGVAELLIGITHDPQFGHTLTLGAGGVWVELFGDTRTLLLPVQRHEIEAALLGLRCAPLLRGYRGRPPAHMPALLDAIEAVLRCVDQHAGRLRELEINPLIALPCGAVAVDAVIRLADLSPCDASP